jgi:Fic/DOC family
LRRPTRALAVAFNQAVRWTDEWFDEPDDLERVERALAAIDEIEDPVVAAAVVAYRVTRNQGFGEGSKRTALLLARGRLTAMVSTARRSSRPTIVSWPTFSSRRRRATTSRRR